jgi:hypothetical protein
MTSCPYRSIRWDMVCLAVPNSKIDIDMEVSSGAPLPVPAAATALRANQYSSWVKMLDSVRGRPLALKLLIQKKATIRWLLAWRPTSLASHRARLPTILATLACFRVIEVARLLTTWRHTGSRASRDVLGAHRSAEKRHGAERAHHTRPLEGDPALDIVEQLRTWLRVAGLAVHRSCCAKRTRPAARCEVCPPLFPLTRCAQGGVTVATDRPCSRQQASDWIRWNVNQAVGYCIRFSGISAQKSPKQSKNVSMRRY